MPESKVLKQVLNKLRFHTDCIWFLRINSGRLGGYSQSKAGTPDVFSLINNGDGTITALFLEVKRTNVSTLRYEQKKFFKDMEGMPKVMCRIINDVKQLDSIIREAKRI